MPSVASVNATRELPVRSEPRFRAALLLPLLVIAVGAAHVWSLWDGTVLDDHWHQHGLRSHGWSWSELIRTTGIAPADFVHLWWQDQTVRWEYARPVFILAMKFFYSVVGHDDPLPLHVFSITLHLASTCMVSWLAWRFGGRNDAALLAGLLFALYHHSTVTVAWSSSQNAVLHVALMLAAFCSYVRGWRSATFGFWLVALFTRENALMLPAILLAFDYSQGGRRACLSYWRRYLAFGAMAVAFVIWRAMQFTQPMPAVYTRLPAGEPLGEYLAWAAGKLLHYVCTAIWPAPMTIGPTGRFNPWVETPGDMLLMTAIVVVLGLAYLRLTRGLSDRWIWPLWIVLAVLPVVPVVATPHSGYACGVGYALGVTRALHGIRIRGMPALSTTAGVLIVAGLGAFFVLSRWQWTGTIAAERYTNEWIGRSPPAAAAEHVFLVNVPFVNIYTPAAMSRALGRDLDDLQWHVLTYAPEPAVIEQRVTVEQVDARTFMITAHEQPFFSRLLGRFLVGAFRRGSPLETGARVETAEFTAEVLEADVGGVRALRFTFAEPLADPRYCFYLATKEAGAVRLFGRPTAARDSVEPQASFRDPSQLARTALRIADGDARAGDQLLAVGRAPTTSPELRAFVQDLLRTAVQPVAAAYGAPVQPCFARAEWSASDWRQLEGWWRSVVDDRRLAELYAGWRATAGLVKQREELPHARQWAGRLIRSDLYLTGPPFPTSRAERDRTMETR